MKSDTGTFLLNVPLLEISRQRRSMQAKTIIIAAVCFFLAVATSVAVQNTGEANLVLDGGKTGSVAFPHKAHQDNLKDCNVCHDTFPQEKGSIDKLKAEGKLKQKQVMNTQCLKCHRDNKKAGKPSGPTGCTSCHSK